MPEYINGTTDILGGSVIRYALNTTTPNQAVIRKIIAGNGISISSTGVDPGTGDVTISIDTSGTGGSGSGGTGEGTPTAVGTVTAVNMIAPEGMYVLGGPITTAGTISLRLSSGYTIPLYTDVQQGKTAYSWGNHSLEGYLTGNIYNSDGTLTGNRTITMGSNSLTFTGVGNVGIGIIPNTSYKLDVYGAARFYSAINSYDFLVQNISGSPYPETSITIASTLDSNYGISKLNLNTGSKVHYISTWGAYGVLGLRVNTSGQSTNTDVSTLFAQRYTDRPMQLLFNFNRNVQIVGNITDEWIYIRAHADTNTSKAFRIVATDYTTDRFTVYGDGTTIVSNLSGTGTRMVVASSTGVLSTQALPTSGGTVTSIGLSMPSAFTVGSSPITSSGTISVTGAGTTLQYIDGTGALQSFPTLLESNNLVAEVRNQSGATMTKGTIVYISSATGNKPLISKALATGDLTSAQTFGMLQTDIANNDIGHVVIIGNVTDVNTFGIAEGTQLYLSGTTAGTWQTTKPYAPTHLVYVGVVLREHVNFGIISVKIQNGYEMDELHDVSARTPANNDGLFWNSTTSLWSKNTIAGVLGYTPVSGIGSTLTSATAGSVLFTGTSGVLQQNNSNFFWDNTNNRLGIGTATPTKSLDVNGDILINGLTATGVTSTIYAGSGTRLRTEANNLVFERESSSGFMKIYINQTTLAATAKSYMGYNNATLNVVLSNEHTSGGLELRTQDIIRQQIFSTGNIVIGSASPTDAGYKLDVNGTVRSQGAFLANSTSRFDNTVSALYIATPAAPTVVVSATGGTMADGTYYYKIVAQDNNGGLTLPSTELAVVVSAGTGTASVALSWAQTANTFAWRVYKGTASNAQDRWFSVLAITYTDTGSAGTLGTVPTVNTTALYQFTSTTAFVNTQLTFSGRGNGIRLVDTTNAIQQIIIGGQNTTAPSSGTGRIAIGHLNTSNTATNYVMQIGYSNVATSSTSAITIQIGFGNTIGANAGTLYPLLIGGSNNFSPTTLLGGFPSGFLIGTGNSTTFALSSIMGWNNIATAENQLIFGYSQTNTNIGGYTDVYFGNGVRSRNQDLIGKAVTINSSGAGDGTDKAGGNLILAGGKGTGTGTPGDVIISTAAPIATGSTLQTLTNRVFIKSGGTNVGIGSTPSVINSLQVSVANQWSGAFVGNLGTARAPSHSYGIHLGYNYTGGSGESNILWGTGDGPYPYLTFSSWDGSSKIDRMVLSDIGKLTLPAYLTSTSFSGTAVGYLAFDLNGNVITVQVPDIGQFKFTPMATPSSPTTGLTYFDSSSNKLRCYDGSIWNDLF